jgi:GDP-4-dehydro-6-deoxy-D-mannose reductase
MLLFGADGFAGSHLREAAERAGLRVVGTSLSGAETELACDLLEPDSVDRAVAKTNPALVVNMAGWASVRGSWEHPEKTFAINSTGVQNLLDVLDARAANAHILCVSSAEVHGKVSEAELPLTEESPVRPASPYGKSKAAMEEMCHRAAASRGLRIAVVRAFNQLGPRQRPDFVASDFARQIAAAEAEGASRVTMRVGNLSAARDFTDVRDSARAFLAVSERQLTGTFNMCSERPVKVQTLIEHMKEATDLDLEVVRDPEQFRPVDTPVVYGSAKRLHLATGWRPRITLERSIRDLLDWWREELR